MIKHYSTVMVISSVLLLGAGCARSTHTESGTAETTSSQQNPKPVAVTVEEPVGWVRFIAEKEKYSFLMPTAWSIKAGASESRLFIGNNKNVDAYMPGAVVMEIGTDALPQNRNLTTALLTRTIGKLNVSSPSEGTTASGTKMISVVFNDQGKTAAGYVIAKDDKSYVYVLASGAISDPFVWDIIRSFNIRQR